MSFRPADRYQSAQELAEDLQRFLDGQRVKAKTVTAVRRASEFGHVVTAGLRLQRSDSSSLRSPLLPLRGLSGRPFPTSLMQVQAQRSPQTLLRNHLSIQSISWHSTAMPTSLAANPRIWDSVPSLCNRTVSLL